MKTNIILLMGTLHMFDCFHFCTFLFSLNCRNTVLTLAVMVHKMLQLPRWNLKRKTHLCIRLLCIAFLCNPNDLNFYDFDGFPRRLRFILPSLLISQLAPLHLLSKYLFSSTLLGFTGFYSANNEKTCLKCIFLSLWFRSVCEYI